MATTKIAAIITKIEHLFNFSLVKIRKLYYNNRATYCFYNKRAAINKVKCSIISIVYDYCYLSKN